MSHENESPDEKNRDFFPAVPFLLELLVNVYQSTVIPRKLPCPKKFLVTRLCFKNSANITTLCFRKWLINVQLAKRMYH